MYEYTEMNGHDIFTKKCDKKSNHTVKIEIITSSHHHHHHHQHNNNHDQYQRRLGRGKETLKFHLGLQRQSASSETEVAPLVRTYSVFLSCQPSA